MLYNLESLTKKELERLFIQESRKVLLGVELGFSHNFIQSSKLNLNQIRKEINRRQPFHLQQAA